MNNFEIAERLVGLFDDEDERDIEEGSFPHAAREFISKAISIDDYATLEEVQDLLVEYLDFMDEVDEAIKE